MCSITSSALIISAFVNCSVFVNDIFDCVPMTFVVVLVAEKEVEDAIKADGGSDAEDNDDEPVASDA